MLLWYLVVMIIALISSFSLFMNLIILYENFLILGIIFIFLDLIFLSVFMLSMGVFFCVFFSFNGLMDGCFSLYFLVFLSIIYVKISKILLMS